MPGTDGPLRPGDQPGRNCRSGLEEGQQNGSGQGAMMDGTGNGDSHDVCNPRHDQLRGNRAA